MLTELQFIKLIQEQNKSGTEGDISLRRVFCEFLAACTYTTLARAEDNTESCVSQSIPAHAYTIDDVISFNNISRHASIVKSFDALQPKALTSSVGRHRQTSSQSTSRLSSSSLKQFSSWKSGMSLTISSNNAGSTSVQTITRH
jgi:hypothetical protein